MIRITQNNDIAQAIIESVRIRLGSGKFASHFYFTTLRFLQIHEEANSFWINVLCKITDRTQHSIRSVP